MANGPHICVEGRKDAMMEQGAPEKGEKEKSRYIDDEAAVSGPEAADEQEQEDGQEAEADPKGSLRQLVVRDRHPTVTKISKVHADQRCASGYKGNPSRARPIAYARRRGDFEGGAPSSKGHHWEDFVPTTAEQRARQRRLGLIE
ncbi:hypothetical protein A4X09_0g6604 [Tilletia walkeri]|uniref:Uncharacterized protein n=1 Tax=Tilletia walkeri TaxID=117179 RepID=A0A8X7N4Q4_9BASI|nr:hypothetical protein A4X09_0g6604 [Tilletia walkeri]